MNHEKTAIKLVKLELGEHQKYAVLADGTGDRDPEEIEPVAIRYYGITRQYVSIILIARNEWEFNFMHIFEKLMYLI